MKLFVMVMSGLLILLMTGVLWAGPNDVSSNGLYLSISPSAVSPFSVETTSTVLSPAKTRTKWGAGMGGSLGYRYGDFRVEGEVMYGRNDVKDIHFDGGGGDMSGYYDMWGATMNLFYDIPTGVRFRPYLGAGLGVVFFEAHDVTLAGFPPTNGSSELFTYKLMAGVSYILSDTWRLLLGYRFMEMSGPDFETGGVPLQGDPVQTHAVQAGVQFYF